MGDSGGEVVIGSPDPPSTPFGLPPRVLLIGGGALALAIVFLLVKRQGSGSVAASGASTTAPGSLTPDAAIALGSLESTLRQRSGDIEALLTGARDDVLDQIGSTETSFLGAIDASNRSTQGDIRNAVGNLSADVHGQALLLANRGASPDQQRYNTWQYARSFATDAASEAYYRDWLHQAGIDWDTGRAL